MWYIKREKEQGAAIPKLIEYFLNLNDISPFFYLKLLHVNEVAC